MLRVLSCDTLVKRADSIWNAGCSHADWEERTNDARGSVRFISILRFWSQGIEITPGTRTDGGVPPAAE